MPIKNRSSTVAVERTVARIECALAKAGATGIAKDYENGRLEALSFKVPGTDGKSIMVRLPINHKAVYDVMCRQVKRPRSGTLAVLEAQAMRTSWKLMQDWVEVQISLIELQRADFLQVFMPYLWDGEQTLYERYRAGSYKALPCLS